jgi:hypothetical protein
MHRSHTVMKRERRMLALASRLFRWTQPAHSVVSIRSPVDLISYCVPFLTSFSLVSISTVWAHEGHQPLPTKGVQIDPRRGNITLTAQARDAIGLETAEVSVGEVASHLRVFVETVAPRNALPNFWRQHSKAASFRRSSGAFTCC